MAKPHLLVDKTEIIVSILMGNNWRNIPITADKVKRIAITPFKVKKMFGKKDSEAILIEVSSAPFPVMLVREKEKEHFDSYVEQLEKWAKNNHITWTNVVKDGGDPIVPNFPK